MPKKSEDATLWECEEMVLRFLLEDGKLNLVLRNLESTKAYQLEALQGKRDCTDQEKLMLAKYEVGAALVLRNAWFHEEALQTTDLPLLIEITARALEAVTANREYFGEGAFGMRLEAMTLHHLTALGRALSEDDVIDNGRVTTLLARHNVVGMVLHHMEVSACSVESVRRVGSVCGAVMYLRCRCVCVLQTSCGSVCMDTCLRPIPVVGT